MESWENPESTCSDGLDEDSLLEHEAWTPQEVTSQYWTTVEDECPISYSKSFERGTVSEDDVSLIAQNKEDSKRRAEEDTLSCSSSDSHASRDTVIMGEGEDRLSETEAEEQRAEDFITHANQSENEEFEAEGVNEALPRDLNRDLKKNSKTEPKPTILPNGNKDSNECTQISLPDDEEPGDHTDMKESVCYLVEEREQPEILPKAERRLSTDDVQQEMCDRPSCAEDMTELDSSK